MAENILNRTFLTYFGCSMLIIASKANSVILTV